MSMDVGSAASVDPEGLPDTQPFEPLGIKWNNDDDTFYGHLVSDSVFLPTVALYKVFLQLRRVPD